MFYRNPFTLDTNITGETLKGAMSALMESQKAEGGGRLPEDALKAEGLSTATGLDSIDLAPGAKRLFPFLTPLRNMIPRVAGNGGEEALCRAITSLNQGQYTAGVPEGQRNEAGVTDVKNFRAPYAVLDTEDVFTWESREAMFPMVDVEATMALGMLQRHMMVEERILLGGNRSLALGQVTNVTLVDVATGGSIADGTTVKVAVVALTLQGFADAGFEGDAEADDIFKVVYSKTPLFGAAYDVKGYCGKLSATQSVAVTSVPNTGSVEVSWDAVPGAVAYAIFSGPTDTSDMKLAYISPINSAVLTIAQGLSSMLANTTGLSSDNSKNAYEFDGVITLVAGAGQGSAASTMFAGTPDTASGATYVTLDTGAAGVGTGFTSNGTGGIREFDTVLKKIYEGRRGAGTKGNKMTVDEIFLSSADIQSATDIVIGGGGAPLYRFNTDVPTGEQPIGNVQVSSGLVTAGVVLTGYVSRWGYNGPRGIKVSVHPDLPRGTVLFVSYMLPYQQSGVQNVLQVKARRDVYYVEWPQNDARKAKSIRASQVLECQAAFALGALFNVGG